MAKSFLILISIIIGACSDATKQNKYFNYILQDDASFHNLIFIDNVNQDSFGITSLDRLLINMGHPANFRDSLNSVFNSRNDSVLYLICDQYYKIDTTNVSSFYNVFNRLNDAKHLSYIKASDFKDIKYHEFVNLLRNLYRKGYLIREIHNKPGTYYVKRFDSSMKPQNLILK